MTVVVFFFSQRGDSSALDYTALRHCVKPRKVGARQSCRTYVVSDWLHGFAGIVSLCAAVALRFFFFFCQSHQALTTAGR